MSICCIQKILNVIIVRDPVQTDKCKKQTKSGTYLNAEQVPTIRPLGN